MNLVHLRCTFQVNVIYLLLYCLHSCISTVNMQGRFVLLLLQQLLYENDSCPRPLACIAMETSGHRHLIPFLVEFFTIISLVPGNRE